MLVVITLAACPKPGQDPSGGGGGGGGGGGARGAGPAGAPRATPAAAAREFLDLLLKGDHATAAARVDPRMKNLINVDVLKEGFTGLAKLGGAVKQVTEKGAQPKDGETIVTLRVALEKFVVDFVISVSATGTITGVVGQPQDQPWAIPDYARAEDVVEQEVTVGKGEWALPGTLTLPSPPAAPKAEERPAPARGAKARPAPRAKPAPLPRYPAVVFVHGSGPGDRDGSMASNKAYKDLAYGLAAQGIASLRYDKRTRVHGAKIVKILDKLTINEETVDDAALAVALLRAHPRIDPKKIVVIGHSQGGYAIPRIARKAPAVAGLVVLAGNTRPLEVLIIEQLTYMVELTKPAGGAPAEAAEKALAAAKAGVEKLKDPKLDRKTPREQLPFGIPAAFWLDLRGYDPAKLAAGLKQPMLVLQGVRDYQVAKADFEGWKKGMAAKKNVTYKTYTDLNHQFMPGYGTSSPAEYLIPNHVSKEVVEDIVRFVLALK
jgi:hypothetical protein